MSMDNKNFHLKPRNFSLKALNPGAKFNLPCPSTTGLTENEKISLGDRIRVKQTVWIVCWFLAFCRTDSTVDHEMSNMNILRSQFSGNALSQTAQRKFTHCKRSRLRITLDTC